MKKGADIVGLMVLVACSFFLTFTAGERGFFASDQSIIFDGGYRIFLGQVPYRDFVSPWGPMVYWIQAFFFYLFGVSYFSYIFHSALFNVFAVILSVVIIRILFPTKKFLSYLAGFLTSAWFYSPFGTPWPEQTGFFFCLFSLTVLLIYIFFWQEKSGLLPSLLLITAGFLSFLAFISKQNVGLLYLPLPLLALIFFQWGRPKKIVGDCAWFMGGVIIGALLFTAYLFLKSDPKNFLTFFFNIPLTEGLARISGKGGRILFPWFLPLWYRGWAVGYFSVITVMLLCGFYLWRGLKKKGEISSRESSALLICFYLTFFQYLFICVSNNQPSNCIPFVGIIGAIVAGLLIRMILSRRGKILFQVFMGVVSVIVFLVGVRVSLTRYVHDIFGGSTFPDYLAREQLKHLRWGHPTLIRCFSCTEEARVEESDIVGLLSYLKDTKSNFFIFPDFTIFYALANVAPSQPLLYFYKGLSYPRVYYRAIDTWIKESLQEHNVKVIVLESVYDEGMERSLDDFPIVKTYIRDNFAQERSIGIFDIYVKKK